MHSQLCSIVCFLGDKQTLATQQTVTTFHTQQRQDDLPKPNALDIMNNGGIDTWLASKDLRETILVLRAVNNKIRKSIMNLLEKNSSMTVTDIYIAMRLEQSVASQHLAILRRAGVVKTNKTGKYIYYSLNERRINQLSYLVHDINAA